MQLYIQTPRYNIIQVEWYYISIVIRLTYQSRTQETGWEEIFISVQDQIRTINHLPIHLHPADHFMQYAVSYEM